MAEYWWIGLILNGIGWLLAGHFHKVARRRKKHIERLEKILKDKVDFWFRAGHQAGVAYQSEVIRQKVDKIIKEKTS